jgi:hypothetical protein
MSKRFLQITFLILIGAVSGFGQTNGWNGLVPLRSTRADVEKLLGAARENYYPTFKYESEHGTARVRYSTGKCRGGWNVPIGTVLRIDVDPVSPEGKNLEALKMDKSKFSSAVDDALYQTWTNAEDGLRYHYAVGSLVTITYLPKRSDNDLRCDGFPPYAPEAQYDAFDRPRFYVAELNEKQDSERILDEVTKFFIRLDNENKASNNEYAGYILIYFDRKLPVAAYRQRAEKIEKRISEITKTSRERVTVIEGGMRSESLLEFYILPANRKPPAPDPTLPSPQFMKKR